MTIFEINIIVPNIAKRVISNNVSELYLVFFVVGVMIWLFSGVIAWEFVEWLDRRKKSKGE